MNIAELIQTIDKTIQDSHKYQNSAAAIRLLRIQNEVIFYLIEKGELNMGDSQRKFYEFITRFNPADLYKVAEHYRKTKGKQPLNFYN